MNQCWTVLINVKKAFNSKIIFSNLLWDFLKIIDWVEGLSSENNQVPGLKKFKSSISYNVSSAIIVTVVTFESSIYVLKAHL